MRWPAPKPPNPYRAVIAATADMVGNARAQELASRYGLQILNVTWEDTGRFKGSCVGPNISDMTIQVQQKNEATGQYDLTCMPVIRFPNFEDKTGDVALDRFFLKVGNEQGRPLHRVSLREYLGDFRRFLSRPSSWKGSEHSLLAPRDSHVLTSAQACFLPVPRDGEAQFNPVLFNYQSSAGAPAVLTILATREGTSATIIDNQRDAFPAGWSWGQRLFFNHDGERAPLTGTRLSDFEAAGGDSTNRLDTPQAASSYGLNMVLMIQVPLLQPVMPRRSMSAMGAPQAAKCCERSRGASDVEEAVIGHGPVEGPYTEIDDLPIRRDPSFPIRVTVQFYKATSNGVVSPSDMEAISRQIERVYADADYVGSLVVDSAEACHPIRRFETLRPTEYVGVKQQPMTWWSDFVRRFEQVSGRRADQAWEEVDRLFRKKN